MRQIVIPALERFKPELIIVACGYDANALDPLARMQLHSDSFRSMTALVQDAADRLCDGKLVMVHEGGLCRVLRALLRAGGDGAA
ncbi:Histone deacetylase-like amidohydrolase [Serratia plymuthica]|uniref:Histone deacetylase-like amidohydrolase n=1 Tax=Serratia plymuthica TaxID=82996 RepID=A0A2X4TU23_SERPL|nr:Histone deacetylase-like amidohydrolase [Serratia plymuthica]